MRHRVLGALAALVATSAHAEIASYGYDTLGRLVGVGRGGGPSDGYRDDFSYDSTDNRSFYWSADTRFTLNVGDSRYSADGRTRLVMQGDGNLVVYFNGSPLWASNTAGTGANRAVLQGDGNFVVYTPSNSFVWQSGTSGKYGAMLLISNDGNVSIADVSRAIAWTTNTGGH